MPQKNKNKKEGYTLVIKLMYALFHIINIVQYFRGEYLGVVAFALFLLMCIAENTERFYIKFIVNND